jgi:hypothetical protein
VARLKGQRVARARPGRPLPKDDDANPEN